MTFSVLWRYSLTGYQTRVPISLFPKNSIEKKNYLLGENLNPSQSKREMLYICINKTQCSYYQKTAQFGNTQWEEVKIAIL